MHSAMLLVIPCCNDLSSSLSQLFVHDFFELDFYFDPQKRWIVKALEVESCRTKALLMASLTRGSCIDFILHDMVIAGRKYPSLPLR